MSDWVRAVWLSANESLSACEGKIQDIVNISGKSADEVREMVSKRAKSRPVTPTDAAEFIYDYYLRFWEFPDE